MYEQGTKPCRLYFGAIGDDPLNGMFSFVPCLPAHEQRTFPRPAIDLEPFVTSNLAMSARTTAVADPSDVTELWHRIVAQVVEQGCALGLRADLPGERRPFG